MGRGPVLAGGSVTRVSPLLRFVPTLAALATFAAVAATARPFPAPISPAGSITALERCDALLLPALDTFERTGTRSDARRALAAALAARDLLEAARLPAALAAARDEELIFFNHVIPGLSAYLKTPGGPAAREALATILRRGRIHRARGLAAAASAAGPHAPR